MPEKSLRFAMLGMIPGNGHPFSWSAIINGYDPALMARNPYPGIAQYLGRQPLESVRVPGAQVTHIWTDDPAEAPVVAAASLIPHVVRKPEDVIGHVDAVFIATDDGFNHVTRVRPFVEAGLPVFVDKPLALSVEDLRTFIAWQKSGVRVLSSSGLRYAPEIEPYVGRSTDLGDLRWVSCVTAKKWDNYGIHGLEPLFRILGPGFTSVHLEATPNAEVAHLAHRSGVQATIPVIRDGGATFGMMHLYGTAGQATFKMTDTYAAFRGQLVNFIDYVRTGRSTYAFEETVELMAVLIAGLRSRAEQSRRVAVAEVLSALSS